MTFQRTSRVALWFILGSVVGRAGNFIFRILGAYFLEADGYADFALFSRTIQLFVPFFGFELHSPLTRKIKLLANKNRDELNNFIWAYRTAAFFGTIAFITLMRLTLPNLPIMLLVVSSISLAIWGLAEFGVAIARGSDLIKEASIFASLSGIFRVLGFGIVLIFLPLSSLSLSYVWVVSFLFVTVYIYRVTRPDSNLMFSRKLPDWKEVFNNLKDSIRVFLAAFGEQGGFYIISLVSYAFLTSEMYRIFDLVLVGISLVSIVTSNLSLSILQQFSSSKVIEFSQRSRNTLLKAISAIFVFCTLLYIGLSISDLDLNILEALHWKYDLSIYKSLRLFIFVPPFMFTASISHGLLQAVGRYNSIAVFSVITFGIIALCAYIFIHNEIVSLLAIGLLLGKIVQSLGYTQKLISG